MTEENKQEKGTDLAKANPMRKIMIEKISLNVGAGKNEDMLKKGLVLLQKLSPQKPVKTTAKKRIPAWGLRPGLAIGCKVTIRKGAADLLKRLLVAKSNTLSEKNFDNGGNFSFGIPEYIDIEGLEYDPDLKILGLEVAVTLGRPGIRLKMRKLKSRKIGKKHLISKDDAIAFMKEFGVEIEK
jgi:large subunit ribosomal protein L5